MQLSRDKTTLSQFWGSTPPPRNPLQMSKKSKLSSATTEGCSLNKLILSSKLRNLTLRNIWYFVSVCSTSLLLQESYRKQVSVNSSKSEPVFAAFFRSKFFQLPLPLAPLLPSQKHHFSFAAGKGVLTVSYGRRWRKWEEKMVSLRGRMGVSRFCAEKSFAPSTARWRQLCRQAHLSIDLSNTHHVDT